MPCNFFEGGVYCTANKLVHLKPYGSDVWLEWHDYLGPSFFRYKNSNTDMQAGPKTWKAFNRWYEESGMRQQREEEAKIYQEVYAELEISNEL